jgi:hypothetical protein
MAVHGFILQVIPKGRVKRFFRLPSHFYCISVGLIPGSCGSAANPTYPSRAKERWSGYVDSVISPTGDQRSRAGGVGALGSIASTGDAPRWIACVTPTIQLRRSMSTFCLPRVFLAGEADRQLRVESGH